MSWPDTLAFLMSSAAAASPPNPPPTICAFISPSLLAPANYSPVAPLTQAPTQFASGLLRYLVRSPGAVIAITQHPSCGGGEVQANPRLWRRGRWRDNGGFYLLRFTRDRAAQTR